MYSDSIYENGRDGLSDGNSLMEMINAETLIYSTFKRKSFIINQLIAPGLTVLAGAPKLGKSWLVLYLCTRISKGEPVWSMETRKGSVLYIALEDSLARLQDRMLTISDDTCPDLYFSTSCPDIQGGLITAIKDFVSRRPDTRMVVIDTFQKIRAQGMEMSYSNDYAETAVLKRLADELEICILLVHHTRKQGDSDCLNEISGTNGIAGCADTLMVLKREKRTERKATLFCTGRDIEDRELTLTLNRESCIWEYVSGALPEESIIPDEIKRIAGYIKKAGSFSGSNAEFSTLLQRECGISLSSSHIKRCMNKHREWLSDNGINFISLRTRDKRLLQIAYSADMDRFICDSGDAKAACDAR